MSWPKKSKKQVVLIDDHEQGWVGEGHEGGGRIF